MRGSKSRDSLVQNISIRQINPCNKVKKKLKSQDFPISKQLSQKYTLQIINNCLSKFKLDQGLTRQQKNLLRLKVSEYFKKQNKNREDCEENQFIQNWQKYNVNNVQLKDKQDIAPLIEIFEKFLHSSGKAKNSKQIQKLQIKLKKQLFLLKRNTNQQELNRQNFACLSKNKSNSKYLKKIQSKQKFKDIQNVKLAKSTAPKTIFKVQDIKTGSNEQNRSWKGKILINKKTNLSKYQQKIINKQDKQCKQKQLGEFTFSLEGKGDISEQHAPYLEWLSKFREKQDSNQFYKKQTTIYTCFSDNTQRQILQKNEYPVISKKEIQSSNNQVINLQGKIEQIKRSTKKMEKITFCNIHDETTNNQATFDNCLTPIRSFGLDRDDQHTFVLAEQDIFTPPELLEECRNFLEKKSQTPSSRNNQISIESFKKMSLYDIAQHLDYSPISQISQNLKSDEYFIDMQLCSKQHETKQKIKQGKLSSIAHHCDETKYLSIRDIFEELFQSDPKAKINEEIIQQLVRKAPPGQQEQLQKLLRKLSKNSCYIEFQDTLTYLLRHQDLNHSFHSQQIIELLDLNNNGYVTLSDFHIFEESFVNGDIEPQETQQIRSIIHKIKSFLAQQNQKGNKLFNNNEYIKYSAFYYMELIKEEYIIEFFKAIQPFQLQVNQLSQQLCPKSQQIKITPWNEN